MEELGISGKKRIGKFKIKQGSESLGYPSKMLNVTPFFFMLFPAPSFPTQGKAEMGQECGIWNLILLLESGGAV